MEELGLEPLVHRECRAGLHRYTVQSAQVLERGGGGGREGGGGESRDMNYSKKRKY